MDVIMKLKCGSTYFNIHQKESIYYASLYGQLPIPYDDYIEKDTLIDMIIQITMDHWTVNTPLEIFDEETKQWYNF
jgi:hypothetical protein